MDINRGKGKYINTVGKVEVSKTEQRKKNKVSEWCKNVKKSRSESEKAEVQEKEIQIH